MLELPIINTHWPLTNYNLVSERVISKSLASHLRLLAKQPSKFKLQGCSESLHKRNFAPSSLKCSEKFRVDNFGDVPFGTGYSNLRSPANQSYKSHFAKKGATNGK